MLFRNVALANTVNNLCKQQITASVAAGPIGLINWSQVRYRKAVEFRKYRQPDFRQKLLLSVCEPIMPIDRRLPSEKCSKLLQKQAKQPHPYDVMLAKDMAEDMENANLVCLFHSNEFPSSQRRNARNEFQHEEMKLRFYNRDIAKICWNDTRYEQLLHFAVGYHFNVLFAPDYSKLGKIFKILKKYPEILLICGLVDKRRLLNIDQLEEVSKMPNLDIQRAIFSQTLQTTSQSLSQSLNYYSGQLSQLLTTHSNPESATETLEDSEKN